MSATNGSRNLGGISHSTEPCTVLISYSAITKCRHGQKEMAKQIARPMLARVLLTGAEMLATALPTV